MTPVFKEWRERLRSSGAIAPLVIGSSLEEVRDLFGAPDRVSSVTKKGKPTILKYADIEFHFDHQKDHRLSLVFSEREDGSATIAITAP